MLTKLQHDNRADRSRAGQWVAIELQDFMKSSRKRKDLQIGGCFMYLLKLRLVLV